MSTKQPLILLHAAIGSKEQLQPLAQSLENSFEIHSFNFEGHGGRESHRKFSMDHFSKNLLEYMEENGLESADIVGYSMGGYVALITAIHHPKKIKSVMTLGTKFTWNPSEANKEVAQLNPLKIEEKVPNFAKKLEDLHAPADWREVLSKTSAMMLTLGKGAALTPKQFEKVECPALLTVGSDDNMVTENETRKIAEALPQGEFYLFEGFQHPIELVDLAVLSIKIKEFFG